MPRTMDVPLTEAELKALFALLMGNQPRLSERDARRLADKLMEALRTFPEG